MGRDGRARKARERRTKRPRIGPTGKKAKPRVAKPKAPRRAAAKRRPPRKAKKRPVLKAKRRPATKAKRRAPGKPKRRSTAKRKPRAAAKAKRKPVSKVRAKPAAKPKRPATSRKAPRAAPDLPPGRKVKAKRGQNRVSVFVGVSVDGFIARKNGDLDFLEAPGDPKAEDYGYKAFVDEIDAIVMGRKTFEKVLSFNSWPYAKTPVFVLTTRPLPVPPRLRGKFETMADRPDEVVRRLARRGLKRLYIDGGRTVQGFLRAGAVHEITITRVPVLLGQGVPLFGALPADVRLKHLETRAFKSGMVQTTYTVKRGGKKEEEAPTVEEEFRLPAAPPAQPALDAKEEEPAKAASSVQPDAEPSEAADSEPKFPEPDPAAGQVGDEE